jgi:hypothetical protein
MINKFVSDAIRSVIYVILRTHNGMESSQLTDRSQNRTINKYKKLKYKVLKCIAKKYFNKQSLEKRSVSKILKNKQQI